MKIEELDNLANYKPQELSDKELGIDLRTAAGWWEKIQSGEDIGYLPDAVLRVATAIINEMLNRGREFHPENWKDASAELFTMAFHGLQSQGVEIPDNVSKLIEGIRPAFGSPGGKRNIAKKEIGYFPEHKIYVEPFFWGGSIFFAKKPSEKEVVNDLDFQIHNAVKCLKEIPADKIRAAMDSFNWISEEPRLREYWKDTTPGLDGMVKFLYGIRGSFSCARKTVSRTKIGTDLKPKMKSLDKIQERLKGVTVRNCDYKKLFEYDTPQTFFYLDPPYPGEWAPELKASTINLAEMVKILEGLEGKFMVAINKENTKFFEGKGWNIVDIPRRTMFSQSNTYGTGERPMDVEIIVMNYEPKETPTWIAESITESIWDVEESWEDKIAAVGAEKRAEWEGDRPPKKLYHVSPIENKGSIYRTGLKHKTGGHPFQDFEPEVKGTYAFEDMGQAIENMRQTDEMSGEPATMMVEFTPEFLPALTKGKEGDWVYQADIPPEKLKFYDTKNKAFVKRADMPIKWITKGGARFPIVEGEKTSEADDGLIWITKGAARFPINISSIDKKLGGVKGTEMLDPDAKKMVYSTLAQLPEEHIRGMKFEVRKDLGKDLNSVTGKKQWVAGVYDASKDTFFMTSDAPPPFIREVVTHETGHRVFDRMIGKKAQEKYFDIWHGDFITTGKYGEVISKYATRNHKEGFAEAYSNYYRGKRNALKSKCPNTYNLISSIKESDGAELPRVKDGMYVVYLNREHDMVDPADAVIVVETRILNNEVAEEKWSVVEGVDLTEQSDDPVRGNEYDPLDWKSELISSETNKELLGRLKYIYELWTIRGAESHDEPIINSYLMLIAEMNRRNMKFDSIPELDEVSAVIMEDLEEGIRPAFGSSGGKKYLAKTIVECFPDHKVYVEPFIGGGAVFFKKKPSETEVINDLDKEISHAYKYIKEGKFDGLKQYRWDGDRAHFEKMLDSEPQTDDEKFYRFIYLLHFSFGNGRTNFAPSKVLVGGAQSNLSCRMARLPQVSERLSNCKVYNTDFRKVMEQYDSPETFFYMDPPYPDQQGKLKTDLTNKDICDAVDGIKGKFIISLPDNPSVRETFKKYHLTEVSVRRTFNMKTAHDDKELLISNFPLQRSNAWLAESVMSKYISFLKENTGWEITKYNPPAVQDDIRESLPFLPEDKFITDADHISFDPSFREDILEGKKPLDQYPTNYAILVAHYRGKSVHGDFRRRVNGFLQGETLAIAPEGFVTEDVDTIAKGRVWTARLMRDGKFRPDMDSVSKVFTVPKTNQPLEWMNAREVVFEPGAVGATKEHVGTFITMDEGMAYPGAQRSDFKEFFLDMNQFKKSRMIERRLETSGGDEQWQSWIAEDAVPYILSPRQRREERTYIPIDSEKAIPPWWEEKIKSANQWWTHGLGESERMRRLDLAYNELVASGDIDGPEIAAEKIHESKPIFTLRFRWWPGASSGGAVAPATDSQYEILIDTCKDTLDRWDLFGRDYGNPLSNEARKKLLATRKFVNISTPNNTSFREWMIWSGSIPPDGAKLYKVKVEGGKEKKTGRIQIILGDGDVVWANPSLVQFNPGDDAWVDQYNNIYSAPKGGPAYGNIVQQPVYIDIIDTGDVEIVKDGQNEKIYRFNGAKLKGEMTFKYDTGPAWRVVDFKGLPESAYYSATQTFTETKMSFTESQMNGVPSYEITGSGHVVFVYGSRAYRLQTTNGGKLLLNKEGDNEPQA